MSDLKEYLAKNVAMNFITQECEEYLGSFTLDDVEYHNGMVTMYVDFTNTKFGMHIRVSNMNENISDSKDWRECGDLEVSVREDYYEKCNWYDTSIRFLWIALLNN